MRAVVDAVVVDAVHTLALLAYNYLYTSFMIHI